MTWRAEFHDRVFIDDPEVALQVGAIPVVAGGVEGWDSRVNVRRAQLERPFGHGSFPTTSFYADRLVTIRGLIPVEDAREVPLVLEAVNGIPLQYGWLQIQQFGTELRAWGALQHVTADRVHSDDGRVGFSLDVWCPEAFRYGRSQTFTLSPGTVQVWHDGTVDAAPVVTVTGPVTSGTLRFELEQYRWDLLGGVGAGETMTVDMRDGLVRSSRRGVVAGAGFGVPLRVAPGKAQVLRVTGAGGRIRVDVPSTFV